MLIDYEMKDNFRYITPCPMRGYDDSQSAIIGGFACDQCAFNQGYIDGQDIKKVDCSFMDCDEEKKKSIVGMETEPKIQCSTCYNHVKKVGDLCDFCLEKIRYDDDIPEPTVEEYAKKILEWSERIGLKKHSTLEKQGFKAVAELGEFFDAILSGTSDDVLMEFGDHMVVLIQMFDRYFSGEKSIADSLKMAFEKINSRTGKIVNGDFIKDE